MKHKVLCNAQTISGVNYYRVEEVDDCFIDIPNKDISEQLESLLVVDNEQIRLWITELLELIEIHCK